jgi:thioester reductase-like protein
VDPGWVDAHRGGIDHVFHLAAIYDMTAGEEVNERMNVTGTRHAVQLSNALGARRLHHVSSVAVSGSHRGLFREDMFDEGQKLPSAYHRTKFESERIVRTEAQVPWRVYRPAIVVGHSQTGEMDKIDGPYYFFQAIQRLRDLLPPWVPLVGPELGWTNIVPVDYVARGLDHIAHLPDLDGQAFHLAHPRGIRSGEVLNASPRPRTRRRWRCGSTRSSRTPCPRASSRCSCASPSCASCATRSSATSGSRARSSSTSASPPVRHPRHGAGARGTGIVVPELDSYADELWRYWEKHLDPDLFRDRSFGAAVNGRTVVITGASSGIGRAAALKIAAAGGIPLLVARGAEKLEEVRAEIEAAGGTAYAYSADLSSTDSIDELVARLLDEHAAIDMLVNNAGRSIRRSVALSLDRFHDYERTMQLNYFGAIKLVMGLLPHMKERGFGHIVNVSSIGVQARRRGSARTWPPRPRSTPGRRSSRARSSASA